MPMYENPIEEKLDELISLIRMLDTKIKFLEDDLAEMKEDIIQIKFHVEDIAVKNDTPQSNEKDKHWKVETF